MTFTYHFELLIKDVILLKLVNAEFSLSRCCRLSSIHAFSPTGGLQPVPAAIPGQVASVLQRDEH